MILCQRRPFCSPSPCTAPPSSSTGPAPLPPPRNPVPRNPVVGYLRRLRSRLRRRWPTFLCTIYQIFVYVGLCIFIERMDSGVFKTYLVSHIVMSAPVLVMQFSSRIPTNPNNLIELLIWSFAQVVCY